MGDGVSVHDERVTGQLEPTEEVHMFSTKVATLEAAAIWMLHIHDTHPKVRLHRFEGQMAWPEDTHDFDFADAFFEVSMHGQVNP